MRSRSGHRNERVEADLQAFLSRAKFDEPGREGNRSGLVYCSVDRTKARRRCVRRERRRRAGQHVHDAAAENLSRMSRILIVEDEAHLAQGLRFNFEAEGHSVQTTDRGEEALARLVQKKEKFDALVLDVMLPGKDGFAVARELREAKNYIPLLMLTARGRPEDVLKGFEAGADDYLPKPFNLAILIARIESLLRRKKWLQDSNTPAAKSAVPETSLPESYSFEGKVVDFQNLRLHMGDKVVQLTLMDMELFRYLS